MRRFHPTFTSTENVPVALAEPDEEEASSIAKPQTSPRFIGQSLDEGTRLASMLDGKMRKLPKEDAITVGIAFTHAGSHLDVDDPKTWKRIASQAVSVSGPTEAEPTEKSQDILTILQEAYVRMVVTHAPVEVEFTLIEGKGRRQGTLTLTPKEPSDGLCLDAEGSVQIRATSFLIDPKLTPVPLKEDNALGRLESVVRKLALVVFMIGIVFLCGTMIVVPGLLEKSQEETPSTHHSTWDGEEVAQEAERAQQVIHAFFAAESSGERARHIIGGKQKLPQLETFYAGEAYHSQKLETILHWDFVTVDGRRHYAAQVSDTAGQRLLAMVDLSGPEPKLNWEALVGFNELPLRAFRQEQRSVPTVMRVLIRPDDYYNHAYSDSGQVACYTLECPHTGTSMHAYVERFSSAYRRLAELFPDKNPLTPSPRQLTVGTLAAPTVPPRRVTLSIAFADEGKPHSQALIMEVLGEDWIYMPAPPLLTHSAVSSEE